MCKRITRFAVAALGLVAVSLLLFQPICDAAELRLPQAQAASQATAAGGDGESCCSMIVAVAPLQAATPAVERLSIAVPEPTIGSPALRPEMLFSGAVASAAPLPVSRYYARSARIQR